MKDNDPKTLELDYHNQMMLKLQILFLAFAELFLPDVYDCDNRGCFTRLTISNDVRTFRKDCTTITILPRLHDDYPGDLGNFLSSTHDIVFQDVMSVTNNLEYHSTILDFNYSESKAKIKNWTIWVEKVFGDLPSVYPQGLTMKERGKLKSFLSIDTIVKGDWLHSRNCAEKLGKTIQNILEFRRNMIFSKVISHPK